MIYYHFTDFLRNQCKGDEIFLEVLRSFFEENKDKNSIKGIGKVSAFTKSIFVFRNKTPYFEAILEERSITLHDQKLTVYFVRAVKNLKNSLQEYVDIRDGKWTEKKPFDINDERDFIAEYERLQHPEIDLQKMPEDLISWQNDYKLKITYDIYESEQWATYAINNSPKDGLRLEDSKIFLNILRKVANQNLLGKLVSRNETTDYYKYVDEDFKIEVLYISVALGQKVYIILFGGSHTIEQKDYSLQINEKFEHLFGTCFNNIQEISEYCLKAYPSWTLKENDLWLKIQKNTEFGNLSLLPEQTDFLDNFKFPKYINGQAGSGKSTILYYLFSNIYYYKCAEEIKGDIIFITENEKLLEHTVNSVYDLVMNNPEFQLSSEDTDLLNLRRHFYSFKDFLRSFLADPEIFSDDRYLDFSKFKLLYENSAISNSIKRRFSAELVWFTITTYVYGLELNDTITYQTYDEKMPKEGKEIISKEDFGIIEKEILKPFYDKLIDADGYWNKITLIKYLIQTNSINRKFEVIFCDESQDFSKVELEFIISLSLYSGYNLENVSQFPIVFAGDALQTVNPTGFRSEVLTSMIYTSLTNPLVGFKLNQKDLVFTPEYNYRSSPTIVTFANVVQNWRKTDLKEDIKYLQKAKRKNSYENQNLNIFVNIDQFLADGELQNKIEFKTIIVPVNNEEIEQYISEFPILKQFKNIISSIDAKGLDFSEVVIFGFGDFFTKSSFGIYERKYFYNKLYVAITRTRDELIIIDSKSSKEVFWDKIIISFIHSEWNQISGRLTTVDELLISNAGNIVQSKDSIVEDDAKAQKEIGWVNKNIPLLKIASNHFLKIGNNQEYYFCLGLIDEISGKYEKAAERYLNKELISNSAAKKRALYSLWNGKHFEKLTSLVSVDGIDKKVLDSLCTVLTEKAEVFDEQDILLYENHTKNLIDIRKNTVWLDDFKNLFIENIINNYQEDLNLRIYEVLKEVFNDGISNTEKEQIADTLQKNGQHNYALKIYENLNVKSVNYYRCKAEISKRRRRHEDYILSLGKIIYEDFGKNRLESIDKAIIAEELYEYYLENELDVNLQPNDPYFYAYVLLGKLYVRNVDDFGSLFEYDETIHYFTKEGRENELLAFFYYLLEEEEFTHIIYNRAIIDWAKLYTKLYGLAELNNEYKILCDLRKISYLPFTGNDRDFDEVHITKISVCNFKQFNKIEIKDIGLLNLIVGDNNIGKTTALEMFLITDDPDEYYKRLIYSYIERAKIIPDKYPTSAKTEYFYRIDETFINDFLNYNNPINPTFVLTSGRRINKLNVLINENQELLSSFKNLNLKRIKKRIDMLSYNDSLMLPLYSYGRGYGKDLSTFFDSYIRKDRKLEVEFIENLKLFILNVENVLLTADGSINLRIKDDIVDKPLHSFGDGANKLFRILVLLTIHKGKILLIDEIDSGIHFSRFERFWEIIITIAVRDNTQIIATTHNLECINYFARALNNGAKDLARVIQISKTDRLKTTTFDFLNFNFALEDNFELRG
ncbi:AAA family ATPase [Sphingobacterium sp. InxBP1]|uniref:AAA family ATPase n=1 Tax=Sphingobacterium sp. InxBP1 TaxID=2870328 RepID=UPI00224315D8|nr:AAA family ATPase [Sphingobacterium sp. InxBP1]MCW8313504.1 AAA family ATPase [Sphingobacterium sp. InxBP1]